MTPTTENEIKNIVKNLQDKKSDGYDGISVYLIKKCIVLILPHLTFIFNLCLQHGIFPELLKQSTVVPVERKPNLINIDKFLPIPWLSAMSKIL